MKSPILLFPCLLVAGTTNIGTRTAWADTETTFNLFLHGYAWGNDLNSNFQFSTEDTLSQAFVGINGPSMRLQAGDISGNWNTLGLAGQGFQGLNYQLPGDRLQTSLLAGRVSVTDILGRQSNSSLFGVRSVYPMRGNTNLNAALIATPGASSLDGSGIATIGFNYQPTLRRRLGIEAAKSRNGNGVQFLSENRGSRFSWRAGARDVSSGFSTAGNPLLRTDRTGYFAQAEYRLNDPVTLLYNLQRYKDGYGGSSRYGELGIRLAFKRWPQVTLFRRNNRSTSLLNLNPDDTLPFGTSGIDIKGYGFQLSHKIGKTTLFLNHTNARYDFLSAGLTGTDNSFWNLFLQRPLNKQTSLQMNILKYDSKAPGLLGDGVSSGTSAGFELTRYVGNNGKTIGIGAQYTKADSGSQGRSSVSPVARLVIPTSKGDVFGIAYQANVIVSDYQGVRLPNRLYLTYSRRVEIGSRPSAAQLRARLEQKKLTQIAGRVFEDRNLNGKWDPGEPGVPGATLTLLTGETVQTNAQGEFVIKELQPGPHKLKLTVTSLPMELSPLAGTNTDIVTTDGKTATTNFPVGRTAQVSGLVFVDANRNGRFDAGEETVPGIVVRVENSEIISFTDPDGRFNLSDLLPGTWRVGVDTSLSADGYVQPANPWQTITVQANGEFSGLQLPVEQPQRPAAETFKFADNGPVEMPPAPAPQRAVELPGKNAPNRVGERAAEPAWERPSATPALAPLKPNEGVTQLTNATVAQPFVVEIDLFADEPVASDVPPITIPTAQNATSTRARNALAKRPVPALNRQKANAVRKKAKATPRKKSSRYSAQRRR